MKLTVSQLRRIIKEEMQRTLKENKLSGSQELMWKAKKQELADWAGLDLNDPVMKAAGVDLRKNLANGIDPDKAFEIVAFKIEDGEYGNDPMYSYDL